MKYNFEAANLGELVRRTIEEKEFVFERQTKT